MKYHKSESYDLMLFKSEQGTVPRGWLTVIIGALCYKPISPILK